MATIRLHIELDSELHRAMKVAAAQQAMTLKDWVIEASREKIRRDDK